MKFYHTECNGVIDVSKRQCQRCKKKWNPVWFRLDPSGIRAVPELRKPAYDPLAKPSTAPGWANNFPLLTRFVDKLPKWPRWARILTVMTIVVVIVLVVRYAICS